MDAATPNALSVASRPITRRGPLGTARNVPAGLAQDVDPTMVG
jgi:hypothetical protein